MTHPIEEAAAAALRGDLVVMPTDTVYGIGARPDDPAATARLFEAKARPRELELPVLVPGVAAAREIAAFDDRAEALAAGFWAGPVTLVLPRTDASRGWDLGGDGATIGVRMPRHLLALALLARTGPLAVTSANRTGSSPPPDCDGIVALFGGAVAVYLCEQAPLDGVASTVVDLSRGAPRILRRGGVREAALLSALEQE